MIIAIIFIAAAFSLSAEDGTDSKPGVSKFMLRGYSHSGFESVTVDKDTETNFVGGSINPILMYKQSDRLFFEAEFEGAFEDGAFEWTLEFADISYVINDYVTLRVGQFLLPFGTFGEKLHPAWINKLATKPLGFGHDGIAPTNDIGVELRGAFYLGSVKLNYQAYAINGPQLKDGSVELDEAGMLNFGYTEDNNSNKAFGGRIGIFPFSNSSMEIGFSGQTGNVGAEGSDYEDVTATLYAVDFSYVKSIKAIKSLIDIKAQYNGSSIDLGGATFAKEDGDLYTFNNETSSYYAQIAIRPSLIKNKFFKNLELAGRWSEIFTPDGALWKNDKRRASIGLNYWLDWKTAIKVGYSVTEGGSLVDDHGDADPNDLGLPPQNNQFYIHWAMGF